jgi:hypothetical protein
MMEGMESEVDGGMMELWRGSFGRGRSRLLVGRSDGQKLLHVLLPVDGMRSQMKRPGGDGKRCERSGGAATCELDASSGMV